MLWSLLAFCEMAQRTISTAFHRYFENKVPENQKLFQEDDGNPVQLKDGVADALLTHFLTPLYRVAMVLRVGGTTYAIYLLAMASFPKKQD
ncbi:cytochrome c oxidase subunit 7A2, mitochondrial-like [Aotus nancymaae]|uniref:cytochrome c oxidase subunit 7A2, mitochondrial-like n=1 Tax=Aotus nancymaae TaxID=37293 RepID=UPI0030FE5AE9